MSVIDKNQKSTFDFNSIIEKVFEPQLLQLGLSIEQIDKQSLDDLIESLEIVNDSIQNAEKFGTYRLKISAEGKIFVAISQTESHIEITALSTLLSRKKRILKRINSLKPRTSQGENKETNRENKIEIIKLAKELIAKSEVQAAIDQLTSNMNDEDVEDELIRLSSSLSYLSKDDRNGIVDRNNLNLERNRITDSLLAIMKDWKKK